jgi:NADPH:quinone reductase-like Zn-dependent oxidoreductase
MRALQFTAYGGPEVLEWGDAPDPHAGPGQIRIAVRAASVNAIDWKTFAGALSGGQPMVGTGYLGYDAAGVVDEVGEGVTGVSVGDEVLGRGRNTQAEYAVLDSWAAKPPSVDWAVAAAAGVAGETGERGLRLLDVKAGDTIFVDGGAGGVGAVAVQMALARGAKVIASASEANHDYLREIGATPVLYGEGVVDRVRAAAGGPVDAVFDVAGKTPVEDLISLAAKPSQVVSIANFAAGQAGARVTGGGADGHPMQALALVAELLAQNKLVIKVQTFPFDRAAEAYRISQSGHVRGKIVLIPDRGRRPRPKATATSIARSIMPTAPPERVELIAHNRVPWERPWLAAHHQHCRRKSGTSLSRSASSRAERRQSRVPPRGQRQMRALPRTVGVGGPTKGTDDSGTSASLSAPRWARHRIAPRGAASRAATPRPYNATSRLPCLVRRTPVSSASVEMTCSMTSATSCVSGSSYVTSMC